ncbi:type II secretion system protein GspD [Oceaniferula spumae]|uniref:Type II secretion system protein GspD n=1 Tax=Oceaniferula spumae TaxID=2979115 RepID=A0AAT9FI95_9BACT
MKSVTSVFLSLTLCAVAQAQTPTKPGEAVKPAGQPGAVPAPNVNPPVPKVPAAPARPPVPGANPAAPQGVQPVNQGVAPQGANRQVDPNALAVPANGVIDGSNWDDQDVADEYTKYTGKRVLLSSATQNLEIRFYQRGPLTNAEAATLLDKILNMEGFAFVPSGVNEVKLLPKAQGSGADAPGDTEIMIDDPNDIPDGDAYISYFMKLNFIKPEDAVRTFTQSIHGLGPGAKIAPVPNASAVIVTGKSSFIRKLVNQKHFIDVAAGNVSTVWVPMKYADAEVVATTLNEIMNSQQQRKTTAGVTTGATGNTGNRNAGRTPTPPVPGVTNTASNGSAAGGAAAGEDIPVQIVANSRLNKIFIMGRPVDIVFVEGLAREFDAPPNKNNYVKRRLRFMIASDFLTVAADALESVGGTIGGGQQNAGGAGGGRQQTTRNQNQNQNRNTGTQTGGNNGTAAESVQEFNVSDIPESLVIGKTLLVADNLANSILVQGPPESIRIVSELIDQLDGRPQQVMISTVFGEVTLDNDVDVGISIGKTARGGSRDGAGNIDTGIGDLIGLGTLGDLTGLNAASANGLNVYGSIKDFTGMIRALETRSDFKILSRPTVYTANNRKAIISSGRRIAVPTNTFTSGATTGTTQSTNIEYRDVLLRFEVVPLINSEEEVTLRISLLNEDTQGVQTIDGNQIPTIVTESLSTTVTVPNHSTVVLGGLVTETSKNTRTGVPVLSSIPGLGRLFRRDLKEIDRRELLIFIQPKIVNGESDQYEAQSDMESRYSVAPSTREFADGVLPSKPKSKVVAPRQAAPSAKSAVPAATKRPGIQYPTRR